MVAAIFAWWWEQMGSLLPPRLRAETTRVRRAIVAQPGRGQMIALFWRRGRRVSPAGTIDIDAPTPGARRRLACLLRADRTSVLERDLSLPIAAERNLAGVLTYEVERLTPFSSDELAWSWRVLSRDRGRGRLAVRLSMMPLAPFGPAMAALAASGLPVTGIEIADSPGDLASGALVIPLDTANATPAWQRRAARAGWALAGLLAVAGAAIPMLRQSNELQALADRAAVLRPDVEAAQALRRKLAAATQGTDIVAAQLARGGDPVQGLAALTDILPDDTYLTTLTLSQRKFVLEGRSAAAARLIGALSKGPVIRDAAFAAPVTRDDAATSDLFSIEARLQAPSP